MPSWKTWLTDTVFPSTDQGLSRAGGLLAARVRFLQARWRSRRAGRFLETGLVTEGHSGVRGPRKGLQGRQRPGRHEAGPGDAARIEGRTPHRVARPKRATRLADAPQPLDDFRPSWPPSHRQAPSWKAGLGVEPAAVVSITVPAGGRFNSPCDTVDTACRNSKIQRVLVITQVAVFPNAS